MRLINHHSEISPRNPSFSLAVLKLNKYFMADFFAAPLLKMKHLLPGWDT